MILCFNCKHKNMDGSLFCAECGSQLIGKESLITQNIDTQKFDSSAERKPRKKITQSFSGDDAWSNLHLLDTGQVLPLSVKNEFTLGRISEDQPIMPDIDLSPYQAYAAGVSRLHAIIKRVQGRIIFVDLGSANGSYINGKKLTFNTEQVLNHGDIIALGKFKLQILFNAE